MGLDDVKRFMSDASKEHLIDTLIRQGVVTSDDAVTLREAVGAWRSGELTMAAVSRWLNSKDGVSVSDAAVRNWLQAQS